MNRLFILFFISISIGCLGQSAAPAKEQRKIILSLGEMLTIKEHKNYVKQMAPYVKEFFMRDSVNRKFLNNTISPYLQPGDTLESYTINEKEILLTLKPKKK